MLNPDQDTKSLQDGNINLSKQSTKPLKPLHDKNAYTPTVILNEIAMRNNLSVKYKTERKVPAAVTDTLSLLSFNNNPQYYSSVPEHQNRKRGKKSPISYLFTVSVEIQGQHTLYGQGLSQQKARHQAALNAIEFIRNDLHILENSSVETKDDVENGYNSNITQLYKVAMSRNFFVEFNVIKELGLPHLKEYIMEVIVGSPKEGILEQNQTLYKSQATGRSKREAKQNAASEILKLMKDLPPITKPVKHRSKNKSSEKKEDPRLEPLHPVSRLSQIMQAKLENEPVYTVIEEKNIKEKRYLYTVKCTSCGKDVVGSGKSKKEAKKEAANAMLRKLDFFPRQQSVIPNVEMQPKKSSLKTSSKDAVGKKKKVKFLDEDQNTKIRS